MSRRAGVAALLHDLDERSPAGFAIALHVRFTAPTFLFQTYPKRWMDFYSSKGLVVQDPTVRWAMQNVGSIRWRDLARIDDERVLERAKDFGLMNGVAISVFLEDSRSIASFARADRDYSDAEMNDLERSLADLHWATTGLERLDAGDLNSLRDLSIRLTT